MAAVPAQSRSYLGWGGGGGNERGNWAQLGEVVGGRGRKGGEAAERSHNVFGPNEDPSGDTAPSKPSR